MGDGQVVTSLPTTGQQPDTYDYDPRNRVTGLITVKLCGFVIPASGSGKASTTFPIKARP